MKPFSETFTRIQRPLVHPAPCRAGQLSCFVQCYPFNFDSRSEHGQNALHFDLFATCNLLQHPMLLVQMNDYLPLQDLAGCFAGQLHCASTCLHLRQLDCARLAFAAIRQTPAIEKKMSLVHIPPQSCCQQLPRCAEDLRLRPPFLFEGT